jgi:hypothetical protein
MTEPKIRSTDWRDQIAAISGQASELELKFGKLYESIQPPLESIRATSAAFQMPQFPQDFLEDWAECGRWHFGPISRHQRCKTSAINLRNGRLQEFRRRSKRLSR